MSEEKTSAKVDASDGHEKTEVTPASAEKEPVATMISAPKKPRRWLRWLIRLFLFILFLLIVLVAGIWFWSGRDGSLAQAVSLAQRFVPMVGESLQTQDIQGSIRQGGKVGFLRWQQERIDVQVTDLSLDWDFGALFHRSLNVEHITADKVQVNVQPADVPQSSEPFAMPELPKNIALPLKVDLNLLKVNSFVYGTAENAFHVDDIQANYHYGNQQHQLELVNLHFNQGNYQTNATLTAFNPTLDALLSASLKSMVPGSEQRVEMHASANLQGALTDLVLKAQAQASVIQAGGFPNGSQEAEPQAVRSEESLPEAVVPSTVPSASLEARITLWNEEVVPYANLDMQQFNLSSLWAQAPQTLLSGTARVTGIERGGDLGIKALQLVADIENGDSGTLDQGRIPLSRLQANAALENRQATLDLLELQLGEQGAITATGAVLIPERGAENLLPLTHVAMKVNDVNPQAILSTLYKDKINGHLKLDHDADLLSYDLSLKALDARRDVATDMKLENMALRGYVSGDQIKVEEFRVKSTNSDLNGLADFQLPYPMLTLLNSDREETWADILNQSVADAHLDLRTPGITAFLEAKQFRSAGGTLMLEMKAPQVQQTLDWVRLLPGALSALRDFNVDGGFELSANIQRGWDSPVVDAKFETTELGVTQRVAAGTAVAGTNTRREQTGGMLQTSTSADTTDAKPAEAVNTASGWEDLARINNTVLTLQGQKTDMALSLQTGAKLKQYVVGLDTKAHGNIQGNLLKIRFNEMDGKLSLLNAESGEMKPIAGATFQDAVDVVWDSSNMRLSSTPGTLELRFADREEMTSTVNWERASWQNGIVDSSGSINSFPALWLLTFVGNLFDDLKLGGDMMLGGRWELHNGAQPRVFAELAHTGGELTLEATSSAFVSSAHSERYKAEINAAYMKLQNDGRTLNFEFLWDTVQAGIINVDLVTTLSRENDAWTIRPDTPVSGHVIAQLPELSVASAFFPTGWRFDGAAIVDTEVYGTVTAPELKGKLTALGVSLRSIIDGISFTNGEVDMTFDSNEVRLNKLLLYGEGANGGTMLAKGYFIFAEKGKVPDVELDLTLDKLKASIHRDRQLALSGNLVMGLKQKTLGLTGNLHVDRALLIIDNAGAPSLDDDVVVVSGKYAAPVVEEVNRPRRRDIYGVTPLLDVKLNLGNDFRVQGYGLQTYLNGELALTHSGWTPLLIGTINTERGRFKAYGQHLTVERGSIVFSGNYMNPVLDVLAIRAQTQEKVGVNILGTATHPKISLYSESGLPESEILSWLILGRSASSDGTEMAILQQAALALASGDGEGVTDKIAGSLGLDEISLGGSSSGDDDSLGGTTVTIGKRLGEKFYISYEQGLHSAMGTFFVFYDISRRLTLRAEAGEDTALDLIYTFRFDGGKKEAIP